MQFCLVRTMHKFDSRYVMKANMYQVVIKLKVRCFLQNPKFSRYASPGNNSNPPTLSRPKRQCWAHTLCNDQYLKSYWINWYRGRERGSTVLGRPLHREWSYRNLCFYTLSHAKKTSHLIFFSAVTHVILRNFTNETRGIYYIPGTLRKWV